LRCVKGLSIPAWDDGTSHLYRQDLDKIAGDDVKCLSAKSRLEPKEGARDHDAADSTCGQMQWVAVNELRAMK